MTSKERVEILLKKEIPDRMGIYEHYWPETLPFWVKDGYPTKKVHKKIGETRWSEENGRGINVETEGDYPDPVDPREYFDYDLFFCGGWFDTQPFTGKREVVEQTDEWEVIKDGRGATHKCWKKKSGTPEHIDFEVTNPVIWKKYREPLFETDKKRFGDLEEIKKNLKEAKKGGKFAVFGNVFIYELMRATIGDQNFLPALLLEPDWIKDFCQVYLDMYKKYYEILFREVGLPDGFWFFEDFGYSKGLFCSPKTYRELIFPYEKALVSFFHDHGLPVLLHTCGDIRKAIPLIIDAGFDCLQPMEAKAGCDVIEIAKEYGREICYMGNINVVQLNTNDYKKVDEEILTKIKKLKEMRIPYFFHSDHSLPPTIKFETYKHAVKIFRENSYYSAL